MLVKVTIRMVRQGKGYAAYIISENKLSSFGITPEKAIEGLCLQLMNSISVFLGAELKQKERQSLYQEITENLSHKEFTTVNIELTL